ncbi:MAG TPA: hypothetical protein VMV82_04450 [Candidatus Dormibacteraeota bacterium]|nr:hypothetical protein [Candidatus Dormibacteraeota bacterium]
MLALATVASLFLNAFGGHWDCVNHSRGQPATRLSYVIAAGPGRHWTIVRWSVASTAEAGTAYVEYLPAIRVWMYDDYHDDGGFYRDFSTGPDARGVWRWYGSHDQLHVDRTDGPESWSVSGGIFRQLYQGVEHGALVTYGSARCARSTS